MERCEISTNLNQFHGRPRASPLCLDSYYHVSCNTETDTNEVTQCDINEIPKINDERLKEGYNKEIISKLTESELVFPTRPVNIYEIFKKVENFNLKEENETIVATRAKTLAMFSMSTKPGWNAKLCVTATDEIQDTPCFVLTCPKKRIEQAGQDVALDSDDAETQQEKLAGRLGILHSWYMVSKNGPNFAPPKIIDYYFIVTCLKIENLKLWVYGKVDGLYKGEPVKIKLNRRWPVINLRQAHYTMCKHTIQSSMNAQQIIKAVDDKTFTSVTHELTDLQTQIGDDGLKYLRYGHNFVHYFFDQFQRCAFKDNSYDCFFAATKTAEDKHFVVSKNDKIALQ